MCDKKYGVQYTLGQLQGEVKQYIYMRERERKETVSTSFLQSYKLENTEWLD